MPPPSSYAAITECAELVRNLLPVNLKPAYPARPEELAPKSWRIIVPLSAPTRALFVLGLYSCQGSRKAAAGNGQRIGVGPHVAKAR